MSDPDSSVAHDVRMRGFSRRHTVDDALAWLDAQLQPLPSEDVPLPVAVGRVLARAVASDLDVPGFDRATMDGYAVVAEDTEGAGPYTRIPLTVVGQALAAAPCAGALGRGQAVRIMTGAPMPHGADAVLPAEWAEIDDPASAAPALRGAGGTVWATTPVSRGKHVGRRGEDVTSGTTVLERGRLLRPQDLGVLSSIGHARVPVVRRPRVRLVVTGNELLPAGARPDGHRIGDANGPMLFALADRDGAMVDWPRPVPDDAEAILEGLTADADVVIVSGGSSVGVEDLAPGLVATHGDLAVHGIAMRPSSPTGLGRMGDRLVFLLPGNPVSALCAYDFFAGRAIRALGGRPKVWPYRSVRAPLARKLSSPVGRVDYARVRVVNGRVEPLSVAGASVLTSTTRADGFVVVPENSEGYPAGADVDVWLYV